MPGYTLDEKTGVYHFDDGVEWTTDESLLVSNEREEDITALHIVKKIFGGTVEKH